MNKQLSVMVSTEGFIGSSDADCKVLKMKKFWYEVLKNKVLKTEDLTIRRCKYWRLKTASEDQSAEEQLLMNNSSVVADHIRRSSQVRSYKFWRTTTDELFISSYTLHQKFIIHQEFTAQTSTNQTRPSVVTFIVQVVFVYVSDLLLPMLHTLIIV